jgi:hypothetical protein
MYHTDPWVPWDQEATHRFLQDGGDAYIITFSVPPVC